MKMDYLDENTQIVVLPNDGNFDQWVQLKATTGKKESVQAKKPGRPPSLLKGDVNREWVDHETTHLIKLWAGYENLYNSCHVHFFNRNIRANTLDTISRELQKVGITATSKQISKKFADLKTYYQFQVRKLEKEKEENLKNENEIESPWRFFEQLHFLNKSMKPIPQSVESNTELEGNNLQRAHRKRKSTTQTLSRNIELPKESLIETPASQHVFQQKGAILPIDENGEMSSDAPNVIAESKTSAPISNITTNEITQLSVVQPSRSVYNEGDDLFCNLLKTQLSQIPDCDSKDELKIEIQKLLLTCKRKINSETQQNQHMPIITSIHSV